MAIRSQNIVNEPLKDEVLELLESLNDILVNYQISHCKTALFMLYSTALLQSTLTKEDFIQNVETTAQALYANGNQFFKDEKLS